MERKDQITPQPDSLPLTLPQAARRFGTIVSVLKSMVNAGIISPEKDIGPVLYGDGRIRPSQFWKIERALEEKEKHPRWEWPAIAHAMPRMRPRN